MFREIDYYFFGASMSNRLYSFGILIRFYFSKCYSTLRNMHQANEIYTTKGISNERLSIFIYFFKFPFKIKQQQQQQSQILSEAK